MLKQYETVFIMTPVLTEEQMKETVEKYQEFLKSKNAEDRVKVSDLAEIVVKALGSPNA